MQKGNVPMKVFIDGQAGTTGLQLEQRLLSRDDVTLLSIDPSLRKNNDAKRAIMEEADVIFLCLPDDEAKISAEMAPKGAVVIDASTAHRTADGWVYGLPELSAKHRSAIANGKRIANPGCHAAGFISIVYPLTESGLLPRDTKLSCTSLTGYSGGGKSLIETYETGRTNGDSLQAPRPYALGLAHKHLPEMKFVSGLEFAPNFMPAVGDMAQGMLVTVPLWSEWLTKSGGVKAVWETLSKHYDGSRFVKVMPMEPESLTEKGFLDPCACNGTNNLELMVFGHDTQVVAAARLDNLGKGASGSAMQCMNIACGLDESTGFDK